MFLLFHFVLFLKRQLEDLWSLSRELALAGLDPSWLWARASTWAGNPSCSRVLPALPGSQAVPPSRLALAVPRARLYGPLSSSLFCAATSPLGSSPPSVKVSVLLCLFGQFVWAVPSIPCASASRPEPQRLLSDQLGKTQTFFSPRAIRSCSRGAASPTQGLACGRLFGSGFACANFRVHRQVETGGKKKAPRCRGVEETRLRAKPPGARGGWMHAWGSRSYLADQCRTIRWQSSPAALGGRQRGPGGSWAP